MSRGTRLQVALVVAFGLQLLTWSQLTRDAGALRVAALAGVVVFGLGWLLRRLRLPAPWIAVAQLVAVHGTATLGVLAVHPASRITQMFELLPTGLAFIRGSAAPMFPNPGATYVLALLVGVLAVAADTVAVSLERPAWSIAPLAMLYAVPAIGLTTAMHFSEFVLLAVGILLVLLANTTFRPRDGAGVRAAAFGTALVVGASALAGTWAISQLVPAFEARRSTEPLQMNDPSLDLKRNLLQGSNEVVVRYRTDDADGHYLKLATLPSLSPSGFALADVRVATGRMPAPPGGARGPARRTSVTVGAFRSEWLPVPWAPTGFDAPGQWGFALDTLDVMALAGPGRSEATEGISYEVRSVDTRPDAAAIARASADAGPDRGMHIALPTDVSGRVRQLARDVTRDAPTAGAKAAALEAYLRSPRFTYSLAPGTGSGDGLATIDDFLFRSRRGYCEQFAGAMAIMARELGIPTRMAVGFTSGTRNGDDWELTARNLHTWPELWLDGLGWVAFEPTPSTGGETGPAPEASGTATPTPGPEATETAEPEPEASAEPSVEPEPVAPGAPSVAVADIAAWVLGALVVLAAVAGVLLAPRWLRTRRRERRLAGTGDARLDTLSAWEEVQDAAADHGLTWPDGSPRFAAERFVARLGADGAAVESLRRLAAASERALYDSSERYDLQGSWRAEVTQVHAALDEEARRRKKTTPRRAGRRR